MSKNKNITWDDLRVYKKLPNRKKNLLTDDFLTTFKHELIKVFSRDDEDLTKATYWSFYTHIEETYGFDKALKIACEKHNLTKAIYEYGAKMPWYEADKFTGDLTLLMVKRGIVEEGEIDTTDYDFIYKNDLGITKQYKIVEKFKGYNIVKYDWCFTEDIDFVENLYNDGNTELIWLN